MDFIIEALFLPNKGWVTDRNEIITAFVDHFENLYETSLDTTTNLNFPSFAHTLSFEDGNNMLREITLEEIKNILHNMSPHKAPGPDGLTAKYFTWQWDLVANHIFEIIKEFFSHGYSPTFIK